MGGWETSRPVKFLPFHFVKLALLTSLVKDNQENFSKFSFFQLTEQHHLGNFQQL